MEIVPAMQKDLEELLDFYSAMCQVLGEKDFLPDGDKGGFPSRAMVEAAIQAGGQFLAREAGQVVAAYLMDHQGDAAYDTVTWPVAAARDQVMVLHALRVLPAWEGRGYARAMVEHAIRTARAAGQKALRLDCIEGNDVPVRLYRACGFRYVDTVPITYADIGVPRRFRLYELAL